MKKLYPMMADVQGKTVVIVGGGKIALRKARGFEGTGALVIIISPGILEELKELPFVTWKEKKFEKEDAQGAHLLFAATDNKKVNEYVVHCANTSQFVNDVSESGHSTFITPAVIRREKLVVAISTSGASPMLAREIKAELERYFPESIAEKVEKYEKNRLSIRKKQ